MTGQEIRELRHRLGLTQQALAGRLGCALRTIASLESGRTRNASHLLEMRLREVMGEQLPALEGREEEKVAIPF